MHPFPRHLLIFSLFFSCFLATSLFLFSSPLQEASFEEGSSEGTRDSLSSADSYNEIPLSEQESFSPSLDPGYYTLFSLNVNDWAHPAESIATVTRVLDIHEQYGVPVDIYVTDPIFRMFVEEQPDLVERLRVSPVATVAYHIRPPTPYYDDFDWYGLSLLSSSEMYDLAYEYETHALQLDTGLPSSAPGGYAYVAQMMGYAPYSVGTTGPGEIGRTVARVYKDLGATFMASHAKKPLTFGRLAEGGLYVRPETQEVKLYEYAKRTQDGAEVLSPFLSEDDSMEESIFLGIKYHEDNFYVFGATPWWKVFWTSQSKEDILSPPYDLSKGDEGGRLQTEEESAQDWDLYVSTVRYVAEHPDLLTPMNLRMLSSHL